MAVVWQLGLAIRSNRWAWQLGLAAFGESGGGCWGMVNPVSRCNRDSGPKLELSSGPIID